MTPPRPAEPTTGEETRSLLAEARTRARALVLDELVAILAQRYRDELSGQLAVPRALPTDSDPGAVTQDAPAPAGAQQRAWYAYCVLRRADAAGPVSVGELTGIEACPVRLVHCGALTTVAADVPLGGFQAAEQAPDLAEDGWLATSARRHERVIERVFSHATVLPFRFGVLYPSRDGLVDAIRAGEPALLDELSRLDGAAEWGVRAYLDRVGPSTTGGDHTPATPSGPSGPDGQGAGTEWMVRRRAAAHASGSARDMARQMACDLHGALSRHARESAVRARPLRATAKAPVLDAAYLVARGRDADLRAETTALSGRHAESGLRFELTGPWPPYTFARLTERVGRG